MRHHYLPMLALALALPGVAGAQCTTTNATSCQCPPGQGTECDLLPDVTTSWYAAINYLSGPNEEAGRVYIDRAELALPTGVAQAA